MQIAIAGHTGFVGTILKNYLSEVGFDLVLINRKDFSNKIDLQNKLKNSDVIINLCGAPIIKSWSKDYKNYLIESRVLPTKDILEVLKTSDREVHLINASAIGIYNSDGEHSEESSNYSTDFTGTIVKEWERSALDNFNENVHVSILRLGLVIDKSGGYLKNILPSFLFKIGIYFKNGSNSLSFLDSVDLCNLVDFVIANKVYGVVNCVAPKCSTNYEFAQVLMKITKCWFLFALPDIFLKLIFGESFYTLKQTPKVFPKRLIDLGFEFKYSCIEDSLKSKLLKN